MYIVTIATGISWAYQLPLKAEEIRNKIEENFESDKESENENEKKSKESEDVKNYKEIICSHLLITLLS